MISPFEWFEELCQLLIKLRKIASHSLLFAKRTNKILDFDKNWILECGDLYLQVSELQFTITSIHKIKNLSVVIFLTKRFLFFTC